MFKETSPIDILALHASGIGAADFARHAQPCAGAQICGGNRMPPLAPSSNYGAKDLPPKKIIDDSFHTGEKTILQMRRGRPVAIRQLDSVHTAPAQAALIDALSFSVKAPVHIEQPSAWVLDELSRFMPINQCVYKQRKGGYAGFKFSADIEGIGLIAWGGKNQREAVLFSMMGGGCSTIYDMQGLQQWLEQYKAKVKRVDVAHDDFEGETYNIQWAIEQYHAGGFNAGGRTPKHQCFGAWLDTSKKEQKGLTLAIGSRCSGKYCRIYQKGKQLGDAASQWTRIEVEWRDQDRDIPYSILTKPAQYLAGAYPCLLGLSNTQSIIKTISKSSKIVYDKAVEHAKQQVGKLLNVMLEVEGGNYMTVVKALIREGTPKRLEPWSYHIKNTPEILARL